MQVLWGSLSLPVYKNKKKSLSKSKIIQSDRWISPLVRIGQASHHEWTSVGKVKWKNSDMRASVTHNQWQLSTFISTDTHNSQHWSRFTERWSHASLFELCWPVRSFLSHDSVICFTSRMAKGYFTVRPASKPPLHGGTAMRRRSTFSPPAGCYHT